jgi:hypothetical protein
LISRFDQVSRPVELLNALAFKALVTGASGIPTHAYREGCDLYLWPDPLPGLVLLWGDHIIGPRVVGDEDDIANFPGLQTEDGPTLISPNASGPAVAALPDDVAVAPPTVDEVWRDAREGDQIEVVIRGKVAEKAVRGGIAVTARAGQSSRSFFFPREHVHNVRLLGRPLEVGAPVRVEYQFGGQDGVLVALHGDWALVEPVSGCKPLLEHVSTVKRRTV